MALVRMLLRWLFPHKHKHSRKKCATIVFLDVVTDHTVAVTFKRDNRKGNHNG